jgi:ubiquinone/menaquinone biosynthesis C-methylase UbiE
MNEKDSITDKNAQEYDAHAQSWQASMSTNMGHRYLEKPAMEKELPATFEGKSTLCIGVGSGDELQEILKRNPIHVIGIDISNELLSIAKSRFPNLEFKKMDMTAMDFPDATFDYVYSSLTFHYAKDWDVLCSEIYRVLKKDGELLFSTHHPEYWSRKTATGNVYTNDRGVTLTEHTALLPGGVTIIYYNHPNTDSINEALVHAGFEIEKSFAPSVTEINQNLLPEQDVKAYTRFKTENAESPLFYIVKGRK